MALHTSTAPATAEQKRRFVVIKDLGCIACRIGLIGYTPPEIHHLLSGGIRRGHDQTIGLCPWHHQGVCAEGVSKRQMAERFGPSLKHSPGAFHEAYGSDDELLARQNGLIQIAAPMQYREPEPERRRRRGSTATPSKIIPRDQAR